MVTVFKDIYSHTPYHVELNSAFDRIKNGNSKQRIDKIRMLSDKEQVDSEKRSLPSWCFSGTFSDRKDDLLIEHSGYIILDFDHEVNPEWKKKEVFKYEFVKAAWISPSGSGVKALVRIADTTQHLAHFLALQQDFANVDNSGKNVSRVCFESYDPDILIRENEKQYTKLKTQVLVSENLNTYDGIERISTWLNNKGNAFVSGNRNTYIFNLASLCCVYGIDKNDCEKHIKHNVISGSNFSLEEASKAINSAYKNNTFGTAEFKNNVLVDKGTTTEVKINQDVYNLDIKPKDVIYGIDAKADALALFRNGYEAVLSTGIVELDTYFKFKKGELTLLTGIGNYGKSTFMKFLLLIQILNGKKVAVFSPEDAPAHEFYNDFVEMYFGCNCIYGQNKPTEMQYEYVYDLITKNIFFIYPKDLSPTPDYIKERFLELIIKEKIEFCMIDPFNQMTNEYNKSGGRSDKYLETLLSDFGRFAKDNNVYFIIVAHPKALQKKVDGNYPCPDVFDIADGAMWNNKMDNILVYHLPFRQTDEKNTTCEFHSKKIRKRKVVGSVGSLEMTYMPDKRRFFFGEKDYLSILLKEVKEEKIKNSQPNLKHDDLEEMFNSSGVDQYGNSETPF